MVLHVHLKALLPAVPNRRIANLASAFLLLAARKRAVRVGKAKLRTQFILHYGKKSWLYHRKRSLLFPLKVQRNNRKAVFKFTVADFFNENHE